MLMSVIRYVYGSRSLESITLLIPWAPRSQSRFSKFFSWRVEIGQGYRSTRREEDVARIRVFRLLATPVRFGCNVAARLGPPDPLHFWSSPSLRFTLGRLLRRPFIRRPCLSTHVSSAIPAGAPSPRSYPSSAHLRFLFIFVSESGMHLRAWIPAILGRYRSIASLKIETNIYISIDGFNVEINISKYISINSNNSYLKILLER